MLSSLEELVLTDNNLGAKSKESGSTQLLKTLGALPHLKRVNLSRNKIARFAPDHLKMQSEFVELQEIDVSFNWLDNELSLWWLTQSKSVNLVIITGNPFASRSTKSGGLSGYANLETELQKNLSAVVINDAGLVDDNGFYLKKRPGQRMQALPYPNPINLESKDATKNKSEFLNAADMMKRGVALHITDIRPDTKIESEIFPRELTKEAQNKDVFTPPNHQQMRFADNQSSEQFPSGQEDGFFITEDVRPGRGSRSGIDGGEAIEEEKSYATEADDSVANRTQNQPGFQSQED